MPEDFTPVMTQLSAADLATLDTLITAGIVNSRTEGVRWAVGRLREHPAYTRLQQQIFESDELKTSSNDASPQSVYLSPSVSSWARWSLSTAGCQAAWPLEAGSTGTFGDDALIAG
jgi:hypothetical protein